MADNITVTPGTGKTVATEDIGGFQVQRVKLALGAAGVDAGDAIAGAGVIGANTLRVVVATDQSAIAVTPAANSAINVAQANGATINIGSGAMSTGTMRVALATDSPGVTTLGQAASSASLPVVIASDQSTINVSEIPAATNGLTLSSAILANSTNATLVKSSAGCIYTIECFNNSATIAYLKIYNASSAPTPGSGTPVWRFLIPGNTAGAGAIHSFTGGGLSLGTGIGYTVTTGIADADTGAVAATSYLVNIGYK